MGISDIDFYKPSFVIDEYHTIDYLKEPGGYSSPPKHKYISYRSSIDEARRILR